MRVILTGGGTGGHIFPAVALAQEFKEKKDWGLSLFTELKLTDVRDNAIDKSIRPLQLVAEMQERSRWGARDSGSGTVPMSDILFVGSKRGLDKRIVSRYGINLTVMDLEGFKGRGLLKKSFSILKAIKCLFTSFSIIREFKPDMVVGTGGYSSCPIIIMASIMGIKAVLLEQNVVPGLANKILSPFVSRIFTAFEDTAAFFPESKVMFAGNPIRREIISCKMPDSREEGDRFNILVLGGSQGSHQINLAMIEALDYLSDIKDEIEITHQSGRDDRYILEDAYNTKGFSGRVIEFIDDIGRAYLKSNLVICRGGAVTLSELMVCGRPSIIIPFPAATDNHQEMNARVLEGKGAALLIRSGDLSGQHLAEVIKGLYKDTERLKDMEKKALTMGKSDASRRIVEECYKNVLCPMSNVKCQTSDIGHRTTSNYV